MSAYPRFEACPRHVGALSRMDFDRALDYAEDCPDCVVQWSKDDRP